MPNPVPSVPPLLRLAMIGSSRGNGHPFSWSALFNGYDATQLAPGHPFAGVLAYLNKQPPETLTIGGARVTHICCTGDGGFTAAEVARFARTPHVVEHPAEVIGQVDAVVIATDDGADHVARARPFVEAGLPVFIDKPLADNLADLAVFEGWVAQGHRILSSSCMRYAKEFIPFHLSTHDLGALRFAGITTAKSWEHYGIHALEAIYPILGPGFVSVRHTGTATRNVVHLTHRRGIDAVVVATQDMLGGFGCLQLCGTSGQAHATFGDTHFAFKAQLAAFVDYLHSRVRPFPFAETVELMHLVIAGLRSREQGGREVTLDELRHP